MSAAKSFEPGAAELRFAPYACGVVVLFAVFTVRAPLAPIGLLVSGFVFGLAVAMVVLFAWRVRSRVLLYLPMLVQFLFLPLIHRFGDLPFCVGCQAIYIYGLTVFGIQSLFRRFIIRFCRMDPAISAAW
jgi:hypothetical protein